MTGGYASIRGGVNVNVKGEQGNDKISVSNFNIKRPRAITAKAAKLQFPEKEKLHSKMLLLAEIQPTL